MRGLTMEDKKLLLIQLIEEDNLSAIETFSDKLGISKEDVIALLKELQTEGKLQGTLTSDEKRFFKSQSWDIAERLHHS